MIMNTQILPNDKEVEKRLEAFETVCRKKTRGAICKKKELQRKVHLK